MSVLTWELPITVYSWDDFNYYDHYSDYYQNPRYFRRYNNREDDLFERPCQCIKLKYCQSFIDILSRTSTTNISPILAQKFRKASCGFRNAEPVVCCPITTSRFNRRNSNKRDQGTTTEEAWVWDVEKESSDSSKEGGFGGWGSPQNRFDPNNFHHNHHYYDYDRKPGRRRNNFHPHFEDPSTKKNCPPGFSREFDLPENITPITPSIDISRASSSSSETTTTESPADSKLSLINSELCGISVNTRIIGGEDAGPGQFPWMARLAYRNLSE